MTEPEQSPEERIAALLAEANTLRGEIADLTGPDAASKAIVPLGQAGAAPAEVTREQFALVRAEAMRKQQRLAAVTEQMRAEMERQQSAMRALMEPLQKQIAQMNFAIHTVNLYLGTEEEIVALRDGDPAPADTPLTLRQEVLSMDEETAAFAADGGIDARHLDVFDEWISQPENLDRVLPETKGVVVLVPRKRGRDYADPWMQQQMAEANKWSYFLIRNGDRLYRMSTDFIVGKHLIPGTDEFTGMFVEKRWNPATRQHETVPLTPGTHAWNKAAEKQDARQRHYMRMALILQGLVDRTTVFHPLPAGGLNLLDMRTYDEGRADLVLDAENRLTDGREPFYDWLARLNGELRVGMRIMGVFNGKEFKDAGEEYTESSSRGSGFYHPNDRLSPVARDSYYAERPADRTLYRLEGRKTVKGQSGFAFKFERTKEREYRDDWGRLEWRAPKTKGTCVVLPTDRFVLPFDLVTVQEIRYYLGSRTNRHAYEHLFPLLHAAIEAKEAEAAEEQPFRARLAAELVAADPVLAAATAGDPDLTAAHAALDPLVDWWKYANKHHRALAGDPTHETAAIKAITSEYLVRSRSNATQSTDAQAEEQMVARLRDHDRRIIAVFRKRDGGYLAFAPQQRRHASPRVARQDMWVTEHTTTKTGRTIKTREWLTVGSRTSGLRGLYLDQAAWDALDRFTHPTEDLTDPEIDALTDGLLDRVAADARTGWGSTAWNGRAFVHDPLDVRGLGIVHTRKDKTFAVWLTDACDPEQIESAPRADNNDRIGYHEYEVRIGWTKTTKDGATLAPREKWTAPREHRGRSYNGGGSPARPWGYYWDGKERGPGEIVVDTAGQAYATAREERIKTWEQARAVLQKPTNDALRVVGRGIRTILEQRAYEAFLAEYLDPELWPGHVKTLRKRVGRDPFEPNFASGRHYRGVPSLLVQALDRLTDGGLSHDGLTVRETAEKAGVDPAALAEQFDEKDSKREPIPGEAFLDLPIWEAAEPAAVEAVEDEHGIEGKDEPDDGFDEHGVRDEDDGTVTLTGVAVEVRDDLVVDDSALPVLREDGE